MRKKFTSWFFKVRPGMLVGFFILLLFALTVQSKKSFRSDTSSEWSQQIRILIPPPKILPKITFGYGPFIADMLWIRTIQDLEYCEVGGCRTGWTFQMLDMITNLVPDFRLPYALGSMSLSVFAGDIEGASKLFRKAINQFPEDWTFYYRAGFHAMENEKLPEKAANLFKMAASKGAPKWVYALATRNYMKAGRKELAELLYITLQKEQLSQEILDRIRERIKSGGP